MNSILVLNNVSKTGLGQFGDGYDVSKNIADPQAIILRSAKLDVDIYPNLMAVGRAGAGVNNINVTKATERGICVFNTPGANANAVAELVFIMLGFYARRVGQALTFAKTIKGDDAAITAQVEAEKAKFSGFELAGKTIGVVGLGKIGVLVANAAVKCGMKVIGCDAFPTLANMHQLDRSVVVARRMDEVLEMADVLTMHVPFSEKTRHIIGAKQIALLKPECILINYARDGIYDDAEVLNALNAKKIGAFITDFPTQALLENDQVICTPHLGASTAESEENCAMMAVRQLKNYLEYGTVVNSVNFPTVEMMPSQAVRSRLVIISKDMPNMIATITGMLGEAGINIQAFTNESNGKIGYNLVDLEMDIDARLVEKIRQIPNVLQVRILNFSE